MYGTRYTRSVCVVDSANHFSKKYALLVFVIEEIEALLKLESDGIEVDKTGTNAVLVSNTSTKEVTVVVAPPKVNSPITGYEVIEVRVVMEYESLILTVAVARIVTVDGTQTHALNNSLYVVCDSTTSVEREPLLSVMLMKFVMVDVVVSSTREVVYVDTGLVVVKPLIV